MKFTFPRKQHDASNIDAWRMIVQTECSIRIARAVNGRNQCREPDVPSMTAVFHTGDFDFSIRNEGDQYCLVRVFGAAAWMLAAMPEEVGRKPKFAQIAHGSELSLAHIIGVRLERQAKHGSIVAETVAE